MTERNILDLALEALRPFAEAGRALEGRGFSDGHEAPTKCTVGMFRRSAAAVEAIEKMKAAPPPAGERQ